MNCFFPLARPAGYKLSPQAQPYSSCWYDTPSGLLYSYFFSSKHAGYLQVAILFVYLSLLTSQRGLKCKGKWRKPTEPLHHPHFPPKWYSNFIYWFADWFVHPVYKFSPQVLIAALAEVEARNLEMSLGLLTRAVGTEKLEPSPALLQGLY